MNTREDMNKALKTIVVPYLRQRGFTGSFPHFRRIEENAELITFQFDRYGGGFVVETATGNKEGLIDPSGKHIPAKKLTAWDIAPGLRRRLKPRSCHESDYWFRYDNHEDCKTVARFVLGLIQEKENKDARQHSNPPPK